MSASTILPAAETTRSCGSGAATCSVSSIPLPGQPGNVEAMRARNRREGIKSEPYRPVLQIPGFVTAGWLVGQALEADANAHALVERGMACAADGWFALADAYRVEADTLSSQNNPQ